MEILHTPWRRSYVVNARRYEGCLFCNLLAQDADEPLSHILHRGGEAYLMLNAYPYTPGHLMAVPLQHGGRLADFSPAQIHELMSLAQLGERLLRRAYGCRRVHVGANLGSAAGAGVPEHLHLHVVARPESPLWERCAQESDSPEPVTETLSRLRAVLATLVQETGSR